MGRLLIRAALVFLAFCAPCAAQTCNVLITTYGGAVGDGSTDNTTAIQNTFNYAQTNGCTVEIPAGTFNYSNNLYAAGITVFGLGPTSILQPTNVNATALEIQGSGTSLANFAMVSTASSRLTPPATSMVYCNGGSNYTIQNLFINGSPSVGIFSVGCTNGLIQNNTVENTLADSISQIDASTYVTVQNNLTINSGDDGISNVSYSSDSGPVSYNTVNANTILANVAGRGMSVVGGSYIAFTNNYVDNQDDYADLYIASESSFNTQGVVGVTASGNTFLHGGPSQGTMTIFNGQTAGQEVNNTTINGNRIYEPTYIPAQYVGSGLINNLLVENNQAYATGAFSSNAATDSSNTITETNNTVISPSSYPGPINPIIGGNVPLFSVPPGSYAGPQSVAISEMTTGDAVTYCTTAGASCAPTTAYSAPILVASSEVVCSLGTNSSSTIPVPSAAVCAAYTISSIPASIGGHVAIGGTAAIH